jgi:hypothetical protein
MPIQVYECKADGEFDIQLTFKDEIPKQFNCPACGKNSKHIIKPPAGIKVNRTWNEKANDYQRNPYTQAKAQLTNTYNTQKDMGAKDLKPPTEENIQFVAKQLSKNKKK